jgi:hypothetical protein
MDALARIAKAEASEVAHGATRADANVNPATGLSTDYLNHFNEAIMLLDMIPAMPECAIELAAWRPLTYCEHFEASHLRHRTLIVAAYEVADPYRRGFFDTLCGAMNRIVLMAQDALCADDPSEPADAFALEAARRLKALAAQANAVIHGFAGEPGGGPTMQEAQATIDAILVR